MGWNYHTYTIMPYWLRYLHCCFWMFLFLLEQLESGPCQPGALDPLIKNVLLDPIGFMIRRAWNLRYSIFFPLGFGIITYGTGTSAKSWSLFCHHCTNYRIDTVLCDTVVSKDLNLSQGGTGIPWSPNLSRMINSTRFYRVIQRRHYSGFSPQVISGPPPVINTSTL
jgi:hypothetical protein